MPCDVNSVLPGGIFSQYYGYIMCCGVLPVQVCLFTQSAVCKPICSHLGTQTCPTYTCLHQTQGQRFPTLLNRFGYKSRSLLSTQINNWSSKRYPVALCWINHAAGNRQEIHVDKDGTSLYLSFISILLINRIKGSQVFPPNLGFDL